MFNKKDFINAIVEELNRENENRVYKEENTLDVCFMISSLDQHIEECKPLMEDLNKHNYWVNGYYEDTTGGYTLGKIRIFIEKPKDEKESEYLCDAYYNYYYEIEFKYDQRDWGYCECAPEHDGYNKEHDCCGMGCDWWASAFSVEKIIDCGTFKWTGYEKDYWEYEKQFNSNEANKKEEVEEYEKQQKKQYIIQQIEELQNKLKELD